MYQDVPSLRSGSIRICWNLLTLCSSKDYKGVKMPVFLQISISILNSGLSIHNRGERGSSLSHSGGCEEPAESDVREAKKWVSKGYNSM